VVRSHPDHAADLGLRDRILAGDREAAERFFERHTDALYEFVSYRAGGDRAATEDVVQEALLAAVQRFGSYDGRASLHAWLCGIARNKLRERRRERRGEPLDELLLAADPEIDALLGRIDAEPLPDWILERRETRALVGATLSSLPPDYRDALTDKYVEGRSLEEMARRAGRGRKATESRLQRAKLAFARVFQLLAGRRGGPA